MSIENFKVGDRVRVQLRGERAGLPPGVLANGLRIEAKRGRVDELWTAEESARRFGTGYREPQAWVKFDDGGAGNWPLWLLERV